MTKILIVGGQGFIGSKVIDRAVSLGWDVTSLNSSYRPKDSELRHAVRHLIADISCKNSLDKALGLVEFDYVVNCSGYIDHSPFFSGGRRAIDMHFIGVLNLVESLNHRLLKSFVNIGSSDEYGDGQPPQAESFRESAISPYSLAKAASSHFLQMMYRTEGFPSTTLRIFLTYGPGQDSKRFIPQVISGCLSNASFSASKGDQLRDFCYISDIVEAIFATLHSPGAHGEIINIGSGVPVSVRQVIEKIRMIVGIGNPMYGNLPYRNGENMALYANTTKAKQVLGWDAKVSLERGLENTIDWYRNSNE